MVGSTRNENHYTSFSQRSDVLEFTLTTAHEKGKPQAHAPSLHFGMVRNTRVNHLLCYESVSTVP